MGRGQIHHLLSNPVYAGRIRHKDQVHEGRHDPIIDPTRFDTIQAQLMDKSAKPRSKPAATHPSPLAGKLFDETGDRLTPSHASKAGKRYRYYISRRLVAGAGGDAGAGWRLPADRLERDLGRAVREHLITGVERGDIDVTDAGSIARLRSHAEALGDGVLNCLDTVRLGNGMLCVDLNAGKIADLLSIAPNCIASEVLSFCRPFSQRRRGVENRLIIGANQPAKDDILIANIARAERWRIALCNGDDLATIAARDGITVKYLGEMLPFGFFGPKLVRAILEGRQPSALTTNWLRRHDLPMSWAEQERILAQI